MSNIVRSTACVNTRKSFNFIKVNSKAIDIGPVGQPGPPGEIGPRGFKGVDGQYGEYKLSGNYYNYTFFLFYQTIKYILEQMLIINLFRTTELL